MLKQTKLVRCSDCRKNLLELLVPENDQDIPSNYYIEAKCPFCDGMSFKYGIGKDMSYRPSHGLSIKDVITKDINNTFILGKQ